MVNLDAILFQRQQVSAVVIFIYPAVPQLCVRLFVLVAVCGAVLNDGANSSINNGVVLPKRVTNVALKQQMIRRVINDRHQHGVAVANVARLIRLNRQKDRRQGVIAIARSLGRHGYKKSVRKASFSDNLKVNISGSQGIAG